LSESSHRKLQGAAEVKEFDGAHDTMRDHSSNVSQQDGSGRLGNPPTYEFKADRFSYIALGTAPFVFSVLFTYFLAFGNYDSDHPVWPIALLVYAIFVGVLLYLSSLRITVRDGLLSYRSLFRGTHSIKLSDIRQARVDVRLLTIPSGRPPYALFIEPLPTADVKPFVINMKLFSRENLRTLFDLLGDKVLDKKHRMGRVTGRRKSP
jgi:hypothetical protein